MEMRSGAEGESLCIGDVDILITSNGVDIYGFSSRRAESVASCSLIPHRMIHIIDELMIQSATNLHVLVMLID